LVFMSWNADGLLNRLAPSKRDAPRGSSIGGNGNNNRATRAAMAMHETILRMKPDVIALQEVWLKASGGPSKTVKDRKWYVRSRVANVRF